MCWPGWARVYGVLTGVVYFCIYFSFLFWSIISILILTSLIVWLLEDWFCRWFGCLIYNLRFFPLFFHHYKSWLPFIGQRHKSISPPKYTLIIMNLSFLEIVHRVLDQRNSMYYTGEIVIVVYSWRLVTNSRCVCNRVNSPWIFIQP